MFDASTVGSVVEGLLDLDNSSVGLGVSLVGSKVVGKTVEGVEEGFVDGDIVSISEGDVVGGEVIGDVEG